MIQSLDLWSVLIIISLAQSLFVISTLLLRGDYKRSDGFWLLLFLLSLVWLQAEFLAIRWPYDIGVSIFYGTRHGLWMLVGVLFYFYIVSISRGNLPRTKVLYLFPFFIFTIIIPLVSKDLLTYRQVHYGMLTPFDNRPDEISFIQYFYSFIFIGQFAFVAYMLILSKREIKAFSQKIKMEYSAVNDRQLNWLHITWIGMLLILLICIVFIAVLFFFTTVYRRHLDYIYVLPVTIFIYLVSYRLANVKWVRPTMNTSIKYEKSGLDDSKITPYINELKQLLEQEQLYLNPELRLKDLSTALNLPPHHLSQVLNQYMDTTFFDLINSYRVKAAKKLITAHPEYTLLQIAFDSGFNNKTSFVNAFKKFEGTTPSGFLKKSA